MGRRRKGLKEARRIVVRIGDLTTVFPLHREFLKSRPADLVTAKQLRPVAVEYLHRLEMHLPDPPPKEEPLRRFDLAPDTGIPGALGDETNPGAIPNLEFNIFEHDPDGPIDLAPEILGVDWDPALWSF
jgi:hypothetical protein